MSGPESVAYGVRVERAPPVTAVSSNAGSNEHGR